MAPSPIRIGIVGAGANTRLHHLPKLRALPGVEILAVCNRRPESSAAVAAEFAIPKIHAHWTDLVRDPEIDAVVIGTWPHLHARVTVAALEAGKHVLCEARMARDAAEARAMLRAAQARPDLVAQLVPSPFTLEVDRTVRRLLAEGYVGDVLAVEARAGRGFLDREAPLGWRQDFDLSGYNVLSLGIWFEAVQRWLGEATRVVAVGKTFARTRLDARGVRRAVRVPDHVNVVADLACGVQLSLTVSAVTGLAPGDGIRLYGSEGTLAFVDGALLGARRGDAALTPIEVPEAERVGWRVEEEFIGAIRGEEEVALTTFEAGYHYMMFTEAVARSMAEGRAVSLPLAINAAA